MTAVVGAIYPRGLVLASDSFRRGTDGAKVYDAVKVFKGPGCLFGAAGNTLYNSPQFGEILHFHKYFMTAFFMNQKNKTAIEEAELVEFYRDYLRLMRRLNNGAVLDAMIGIPGQTPTLLTINGGMEGAQWVDNSIWAAIGNAQTYADFVLTPHTIPKKHLDHMQSLATPPPIRHQQFSSRQEAQDWQGQVIEWCSLAFPDSCGGRIQYQYFDV